MTKTEQQEWDDVISEYQEENGIETDETGAETNSDDKSDDNKGDDNSDDKSDDSAKDDKKTEEGSDSDENKADEAEKDGTEKKDGSEEKTTEGTDQNDSKEKGESAESKKGDKTDELSIKEMVDQAIRESRTAERSHTSDAEALKTDIREKLYPDAPKELVDADGDPIRSIYDVMQLKNPQTGEAFTEAEAGAFLLTAQQEFNKDREAETKRVEEVAELNIDLMDKIESIKVKYGSVLEKYPDKAKHVTQAFQKTLELDGEVVLKAPMDITEFYELAFANEIAEAANAPAATTTENKEEEPKKDPAKTASNRGDITTGSKSGDQMSKEDKEWADAVKDYYSDN